MSKRVDVELKNVYTRPSDIAVERLISLNIIHKNDESFYKESDYNWIYIDSDGIPCKIGPLICDNYHEMNEVMVQDGVFLNCSHIREVDDVFFKLIDHDTIRSFNKCNKNNIQLGLFMNRTDIDKIYVTKNGEIYLSPMNSMSDEKPDIDISKFKEVVMIEDLMYYKKSLIKSIYDTAGNHVEAGDSVLLFDPSSRKWSYERVVLEVNNHLYTIFEKSLSDITIRLDDIDPKHIVVMNKYDGCSNVYSSDDLKISPSSFYKPHNKESYDNQRTINE